MKKTMIAMAVAGVVAAPIASADVAISGKVEQTFTNSAAENSTHNGAWYNSTDVKVGFKATEDLGNGMSAFASIVLDVDEMNSATLSADQTQDNVVGVSGGFGTVVAGRMEDFTEGKVMSMVDVLGGSSVEPTGNFARTDSGVAYVSPSMNGFTVGVAGYVLGNGDKDGLDATDTVLMYANGPLAINIAYENDMQAASGTTGRDIVSMGIKYTAGDLALSAVHASSSYDDSSTTDATDTAFTAVYNLGNNSIALGSNNDETGASGGTTGVDNVVAELRHNFSSRTRAYVGVKSSSSDANDASYVGIEHSF